MAGAEPNTLIKLNFCQSLLASMATRACLIAGDTGECKHVLHRSRMPLSVTSVERLPAGALASYASGTSNI